MPHDEPFNRNCWFGAQQPQETVNGKVILVTRFGGGLRAVDISNPYRPEPVPPRGNRAFAALIPPVTVLEAHDIVLPEIGAALYFDDVQRDLSRILQPVRGAQRDVGGLVLGQDLFRVA